MIVKRKIILLILGMAAIINLVACGANVASSTSGTSGSEMSRRTVKKADTNYTTTAEYTTVDSPTTNSTTVAESEEIRTSTTSERTEWNLQIDTVTLDEIPVTEEAFKDNVLTVLNIWGTWCPPCVEELPELQEVSERFKDKNVQIVGVLQDGIFDVEIPDYDTIEVGKILAADAEAKYLMILPDETLMTRFIDDMQYFPTTFFLDSNGEVVHTEIGANNADSWEMVINEVLAAIS